MKRFSLFALLFLSPLSVRAEDPTQAPPPGYTLQRLFNMLNDRDPAVNTASLMVGEDLRAAGIYIHPATNFFLQAVENTFWLRDIEKPEGVLLFESQGHKIMFLQGALNRDTQEGRFHLKFLTNGLTKTYETCDFLLKNSANGWYVQNAYTGLRVNQMKVITWSLGIRTLQGICKN